MKIILCISKENARSGTTLQAMVGAFIETSWSNKQRGPCSDFAEFFASHGNLSRELLAKNCTGFAFDKIELPSVTDALSVNGVNLYLTALALKRAGLLLRNLN